MSRSSWTWVDVDAISLFSGAGGFEIGFERAGIQTVLQAESDPWCRQVLERHWPDVERVTDVRSVARGFRPGMGRGVAVRAGARGQATHNADLVYGGFPCTDVSVAGKRAGLFGERSGLWVEFRRVLRELRPRWVAIENVPGLTSICSCAACRLVLKWAAEHKAERAASGRTGSCGCAECSAGQELRASHTGRDFANLLADLEELGYGWAYRVYDARFFGVPQRRRRVFVVGCLGDEARAAAVLAVCESCGGHPAPRQEAKEGLACSLTSGSHGAGSNMPGRHKEDDVNLVVARGLTARQERLAGDSDNFVIDGQNAAVVDEVGSLGTGSAHGNRGFMVANGLRASDGHHGHSSPRGDGADNLVAFEPMGVRRLTPLECERLMGWPDEWTRWTADGREIPDSHRYRLCGNGVVSTVAEWIGHRLVAVDDMREAHAA